MLKKVVSNSRIVNAVLEIENILSIEFPKAYEYYSVINFSNNDIYVSTVDSKCKVGCDDVMCVPSGTEYNHYNGLGGNKEIYLCGSGAVTVVAKDDALNNYITTFKSEVGSSAESQIIFSIRANFPTVGQSDKLYIDIETSKSYIFTDDYHLVGDGFNTTDWESIM